MKKVNGIVSGVGLAVVLGAFIAAATSIAALGSALQHHGQPELGKRVLYLLPSLIIGSLFIIAAVVHSKRQTKGAEQRSPKDVECGEATNENLAALIAYGGILLLATVVMESVMVIGMRT